MVLQTRIQGDNVDVYINIYYNIGRCLKMAKTPDIVGTLEELGIRFLILAIVFGVSAWVIVYSIQSLTGMVGGLSAGIVIGLICGAVLMHFCHTGFGPVIVWIHRIRTLF